MLRHAHKAPLKLSHFCRTFQAPPGGYNKKKPTIQAAFETVNRGFFFGALEGTRIPGPLIKRIKDVSFVNSRICAESLYSICHRHFIAVHPLHCLHTVEYFATVIQPFRCAKSVQKCADGQNKAQWTNQSLVLWQGLGHPNRHRLYRNEVPHEQAAFLPLLRKSDLHSRKN